MLLSPLELMLPCGMSAYLGNGFPSLGLGVQLLLTKLPDLDFAKLSNSSLVEQITPEAFMIGFSNSKWEIRDVRFMFTFLGATNLRNKL